MPTLKRWSFAFVFSLSCSISYAEWLPVASHDFYGRQLSHYIDPSRITREGATIKFYLKEVSEPSPEVKGQKVGYRMLLKRVRCNDLSTQEVHIWLYPEGGGMPILDAPVPLNEQKWQENAPDTIGEKIAAFACTAAKTQQPSSPRENITTPLRGKVM